MTLVNIDLKNAGYETGADDRVVFYSPANRNEQGTIISTAETSVPLVDGQAEKELAPGPVVVQILAQGVADTRPKSGYVPDEGPVSLWDVVLDWTPALVDQGILAILDALDGALGQVGGAVDDAIGTRLDGKSNVGHKHASVDIDDATHHVGAAAFPNRVVRTNPSGKLTVALSSVTETTDVTSKQYVDNKTGPAEVTQYISTTDNRFAGRLVKLDSNGKLVINTPSITSPSEPTSKKYVDDLIASVSSLVNGRAPRVHTHKSVDIDDATFHMGDQTLPNRLLRTNAAGKISIPTSSITGFNDPVNKLYVDQAVANAGGGTDRAYVDAQDAATLDAAMQAINAISDGAVKQEADRAAGAAQQAVAAKVHVDAQVDAIDTAFTESIPPYLQRTSPGGLEKSYGAGSLSISPYEWRTEQRKAVLFQDGELLFAQVRPAGDFRIFRSTDRGQTWEPRGALLGQSNHLARISTTGTLIAVHGDGRVERSTDDGLTWTLQHTAHCGPLTPPVDTPSGNIVWGEYNQSSSHSHKIWVSTDDGVTWTSTLGSPPSPNDARHWHSVCWDPYEECLVAFHDQSDYPHHYRSDDEGLTWQLIRAVQDVALDPDWVQPMFFEGWIAWGYDSRRNGIISRIRREDYYSGNWTRETIEDVVQLSPKVFYGAMPIRPGVWLVAQAAETILRDPAVGSGAYSQEVHIVSQEGGQVSAGVEYSPPKATVHKLDNGKFQFPNVPHTAVNVGVRGDSWMNINMAYLPSTMGAIPFSVGWNHGARMISAGAGAISPHLRQGESLLAIDSGDTARAVMGLETSGELRITGRTTTNQQQLRLGDAIRFVTQGVNRLSIDTNGVSLDGSRLLLNGGASVSVQSGAGSPNDVVTASLGSLYIDSASGAWWRKTGAGIHGWAQVDAVASTTELEDQSSAVNAYGKGLGQSVFNSTDRRPVWATGSTADAPWVDATGTEAHAPQ